MKVNGLVELRIQRRMKQADVVDASCGAISQPKLSGIERGLRVSNLNILRKTVLDLGKVYGVEMSIEQFLALQAGEVVELVEVPEVSHVG